MPRVTNTLKLKSFRFNAHRIEQLERVVEYALTQGVQLDPLSCKTIWYMLDRWESVLGVLREVEREQEKNKKILGRLK